MRIRLTFILAATTLVATLPDFASARDLPPGFIMQTHRSAGKLGPENTLESCYFAWHLGTIPEIDVRTTADGVLVAFHDENFGRVVKNLPEGFVKKGIEHFTFAQLQQLDVGAFMGEYFEGQRIPALTSIFAEMQKHPDYRLYLDIKDVSLETLAEAVQAAGLAERVILASPNFAKTKLWSELLPTSHTLLWMGGSEAKLRERIEWLMTRDFAGITQLQIHVRLDNTTPDPNDFFPSPSFLREVGVELKSRNIVYMALPWMPREDIYTTLMDLGVESFATDYPQRSIRAVNAYQKNR